MSSYLSACSAILAILSAYLLIIIIQMNSECQNINCMLQTQKLAQLLQSERKNHLLEVRQIEQSLELFAKTKREESANLQMIADKLTFKVQKYKSRCCNLNDRIKQENQIIKSLTSKISSLEALLKESRDQVDRQKTIEFDQNKIISGLKQTIILLQSQIKQLSLKINLQAKEIQNLCTQLANKTDMQNRFRNAEFISEEQYQRQTALLRETLKLELNKSTSDLFSFPSPRKEIEFVQERKPLMQPEQNKYQNQLRMLANTLQYGASYVAIAQLPQLSLKQTQYILGFFKKLITKNSQNQEQIAKLQQTNQSLIQTLRSKLSEMEENIVQQQKFTNNMSTQTPYNDVIDQLHQTNSFLRIKMLELSEFIGNSVHFSAYLYHLSAYQRQKMRYYKRHGKLKKKLGIDSKKTFKQIALGVLFIEYLSKKARKTKNRMQTMNLKQNINVADGRLQLLLLKCLSLKQFYQRKNPVIQRLLKQKAKINSQNILGTFGQMVQQETIGISLSKDHQLDTDVFKTNQL